MQLTLSFILALIPALIWAFFVFKDSRRKGVSLLMFSGGLVAVMLMLGVQFLGDWVGQFDLAKFLSGYFSDQLTLEVVSNIWSVIQDYNPIALLRDRTAALLVIFVVAGALEEIFKQWLVRYLDDRNLLIRDINTSIRYSFMAALGFAFAENIFYFYSIWQNLGAASLFAPVVFRTTFTTAAHMCFSGIWGYYYGIGKFCVNIVEAEKWRGKRMFFTRFVAWFSRMPITQSFRELMILRGLFLAMVLHGIFNYLLEIGNVIAVMFLVAAAFGILMYLLKRKSGNLVLVNDVDSRQISTMASKDESAVIEFIGQLYNQGKFDQVIETCDRLLERDPDNNVVKLFQAKAFDKKKLQGYIRQLVQKKDLAASKIPPKQ